MPRRKHQPTGAERALLLALEGAARSVAESEEVRDRLIRQARLAGAIWEDIARAADLAKDTVKRIVEEQAGRG